MSLKFSDGQESQDRIEKLQEELKKKEAEIIRLREKLEDKDDRKPIFRLSHRDIERYGRQLILPEVGVRGQLCLANESVLIVGAGGLGCPAAIYLAAAGVGYIGIVDYDEVELNNLHRQILHTESRIGMKKTNSMSETIHRLNSSIKCETYHMQLDQRNAIELVAKYNIVVDATDNVATRYLINDACVLNDKPLVSGSALRFEGQLTVYHHGDGPCYRCLHPVPPPPETVGNCSDSGVLGVVPGIIGCLQALEVIKISIGMDDLYSHKLLLFDGLAGSFRTIKLRPRQANCAVCGDVPTVTELINYEQFCGASADDKHRPHNLLQPCDHLSVHDYAEIKARNKAHLLVDVRLPVEQDICKFDNAINIPFAKINDKDSFKLIESKLKENKCPVYVICRNGNDSQKAVQVLKSKLASDIIIKNIIGGTNTWAREVDDDFPMY